MSTLGKVLETVVFKRLNAFAEQHGLLPQEQIGARRGRSTKTSLETIVEAVHTVWKCNKNNVASLLSLDIAGTFDNVSHQRLFHNLKVKQVPK